MCGIYVKLGKSNLSDSIRKLKKLEYRGYDAYGYSMIDGSGQYIRFRTTERINPNEIPIEQAAIDFIGHTRWASQGNNSINDTQPVVFDKNGSREQLGSFVKRGWGLDKEKEIISIVHNGDISFFHSYTKNYLPHRVSYRIDKTGCSSDTAIACDGLDQCFREFDNLSDALLEFKKRCVGDYAIVGITNYYKNSGCTTEIDWQVFAITNNMPLFYDETGQICSDTICMGGDYTQITNNLILIYDELALWEYELIDGNLYATTCKSIKDSSVSKVEEIKPAESLEPVMLKEIREQQRLFTKNEWDIGLKAILDSQKFKRIHLYGCGSSYYAGLFCLPFIRERFPYSDISYPSEFYEKVEKDTLYLGITQSGESKDTIDLTKTLIENGIEPWLITNNPKSYCTQIVNGRILNINVGKEDAVGATKTFSGTILTILNNISPFLIQKEIDFSNLEKQAITISQEIMNYKNVVVLGTGYGLPIAMEASLKLKEICYIHAEGCVTSNFKHGPISLVSDDILSVFILSDSDNKRVKLNIKQVLARKGKVMVVGSEDGFEETIRAIVPCDIENGVLNYYMGVLVFFQYLSHFIATQNNIDSSRPRNISKVITVN